MHFARLENSPHLQKLLATLKRGGWWSTLELTDATRLPSVSTRIGELRRNGYTVQHRRRPSDRSIHEYKLLGYASVNDEAAPPPEPRPEFELTMPEARP